MPNTGSDTTSAHSDATTNTSAADRAANAPWNNGTEGSASVNPTTANAAATPSDRPAERRAAADNSRVNERDRGGSTLTPMDQGPSPVDRQLTQQIRQEIMKDKSLSFTAKNVKIITVNGKVTLRGPVKTEAERTAIEAAARKIAGSGARVDSQLELSK